MSFVFEHREYISLNHVDGTAKIDVSVTFEQIPKIIEMLQVHYDGCMRLKGTASQS